MLDGPRLSPEPSRGTELGGGDPVGRLLDGLLELASVNRVAALTLVPVEPDIVEAVMVRGGRVLGSLRFPGVIGSDLSRRLRLLAHLDPWSEAPDRGVLRLPYAGGGPFSVSFAPADQGERIILERQPDLDT